MPESGDVTCDANVYRLVPCVVVLQYPKRKMLDHILRQAGIHMYAWSIRNGKGKLLLSPLFYVVCSVIEIASTMARLSTNQIRHGGAPEIPKAKVTERLRFCRRTGRCIHACMQCPK
jgi:hypothetical protein